MPLQAETRVPTFKRVVHTTGLNVDHEKPTFILIFLAYHFQIQSRCALWLCRILIGSSILGKVKSFGNFIGTSGRGVPLALCSWCIMMHPPSEMPYGLQGVKTFATPDITVTVIGDRHDPALIKDDPPAGRRQAVWSIIWRGNMYLFEGSHSGNRRNQADALPTMPLDIALNFWNTIIVYVIGNWYDHSRIEDDPQHQHGGSIHHQPRQKPPILKLFCNIG